MGTGIWERTIVGTCHMVTLLSIQLGRPNEEKDREGVLMD